MSAPQPPPGRRPRPGRGGGTAPGRIDPVDPRDPLDPPFDPPGGQVELPGEVLVGLMPTDRPLALLPVRLVTRFRRPAPGAAPTELVVRIFPDVLHADGHVPGLSATEIAVGQAYWEQVWRAGPGASAAADQWVVDVLGAPRAAWVTGRTAPANAADAPAAPVPEGEPLVPAPRFPALRPRPQAGPTVARLLPERWLVVVRRSVEHVQRVWSEPVRPDLVMAPNLADLPAGAGARELLTAQGLDWTVDLDAAIGAGMAVRVPWERIPGAPMVTELLAVGVRGARDDASGLAALLDAHRFTDGVELVPPGTPTNNTETAAAGGTAPDDPTAFLDRQAAAGPAARPTIGDPARLGTFAAADALAVALGLTGPAAFDHAEHAAQRWTRSARDMNRALFPGTWAAFLRELLATGGEPPLPDDDVRWLADWARDWVRGGGFLPAFRVGNQPYGVLPVARRPVFGDDLGRSRLDTLQAVLLDADDDWWRSADAVDTYAPPPTPPFSWPLDPEEDAVRLAAVLGAVPHPTAFRLRGAPDVAADLAAEWSAGLATLDDLIAGTSPRLRDDTYEAEEKATLEGGTLDEQNLSLVRLRDVAEDLAGAGGSADQLAAAAATRDHVDEVLRPQTAAHALRAELRDRPGASGWMAVFSQAHLPTADDPPLWHVRYGDDGAAADGTFPDLRLVPGGSAQEIAALLRGYAADARAAGSLPRPGYLPGESASLLEKLVQRSVMTVRAADREELALGLDGLADMLEDGDAPVDLAAELERLLRETLGTAMYRYDAWAVSVANRRLGRLREALPAGLLAGGFGWLVNLVPDDGGPDTQGFVHAPSLDHAATAAVLRSAWLAYADTASDAAYAVDLSSARVRAATWLLEGVRNGVDLAELLGARLERRLHDHGLSHLVADVRDRVAAALGTGGVPAGGIVDGLAVAVAYSPSSAPDAVRATLDELRSTLNGFPADALLPQLLGTVGDLDATNDLLTAQAVHSVVKGNLPEAAATLGAAGAGESGVPQLRLPDVPRGGRTVEHRIVALLPAPPAPDPARPLAEIVHPALATWWRGLLPALGGVRVVAATADGGRWESTLGVLGLGPVEVIALAPTDGDPGAGRLGALLRAVAAAQSGPGAGPVTLDPAAGPGPTLADVVLVAGALRSATGRARALTGPDLASATGDVGSDGPAPGAAVDVADLDARRQAAATRLAALAAAAPGRSTLLGRLPDLALVDSEGLVHALSGADDADVAARAATLLASVAARAAALAVPPDVVAAPAEEQAAALAGRLAEAVPGLPVLARLVPADAAGLRTAFATPHAPAQVPVEVLSWLLAAGRVHPGAAGCAEALDLAEALDPRAAARPSVAQLPVVEDEPWVAVRLPADGSARLDLVSVSDAVAALATGVVCGVVLDAWTESVPDDAVTTGVAFHLDSPAAKAPQTVLLLTPPEDGPWTVDELETQLLQTLQLAQVRGIGPETLASLGHTLPAVFLPAGVAVETRTGPLPPIIDVDLNLDLGAGAGLGGRRAGEPGIP